MITENSLDIMYNDINNPDLECLSVKDRVDTQINEMIMNSSIKVHTDDLMELIIVCICRGIRINISPINHEVIIVSI